MSLPLAFSVGLICGGMLVAAIIAVSRDQIERLRLAALADDHITRFRP